MSPFQPIEVYRYTKDRLSIGSLEAFLGESHEGDSGSVTWINLSNLEGLETLARLPQLAGVHPVLMDNLRLLNQRSKLEIHQDYAYFVTKLLAKEADGIEAKQLSILYFPDLLITIAEAPHDAFDEIKGRLRNPADALRRHGQDFLLYVIFDDLVDDTNRVLDEVTEAIDDDEERLVKTPTLDMMKSMQQYKKSLYLIYRSVWPLREILNRIIHEEVAWISPHIGRYHRDVLDHLYQVLDVVDLYREIVSTMMDVYLSSLSIRMNEIMKVLTIISTIFMPLTFLVGLYGMNFKHMPEFELVWFYPFLWVLMILIALSMVIFFKRRKWF